jgi:glycosyltransferase involved in cell wall biosynthesis
MSRTAFSSKLLTRIGKKKKMPTLRVCVLGSGTYCLSGISYYTHHLAAALADSCQVSVILMRRLLPTCLYPGRNRTGRRLTSMTYPPTMRVVDGVDWYWLPSIGRALALLVTERPHVVVLQWWTGTILHTYFLLSLVARILGTRIVVEFHEVLDSGELRIWLAKAYVRAMASAVLRLAAGFVVHSQFDRAALVRWYPLGARPIALIPHGPFQQYQRPDPTLPSRAVPAACCNLLFFGVIRPYKGLEDLVRAFDALPEEMIADYWLTIVGETWEGWTLPAELIARSRHRERITFVNRYVTDEEVAAYFAAADAVVLPYRRSSASGPLHVAMAHGLPVVVTDVGGLPEAVASYEGAVFVPPGDPKAICLALEEVAKRRGTRFADRHSWDRTVEGYADLFARLRGVELPELTRQVLDSARALSTQVKDPVPANPTGARCPGGAAAPGMWARE